MTREFIKRLPTRNLSPSLFQSKLPVADTFVCYLIFHFGASSDRSYTSILTLLLYYLVVCLSNFGFGGSLLDRQHLPHLNGLGCKVGIVAPARVGDPTGNSLFRSCFFRDREFR